MSKIESIHFYSCFQAKIFLRFLSSPLWAEGNYPFPQKNVFGKSIFPRRKGWEEYGAEKSPKLNLQVCWSRVLINSTIFATFKFLVSDLLCHNLDSSKLKHEGFLFLIRIHSNEGGTATARHGVTKKTSTKRLEHTGIPFRKSLELKCIC